MCGIGGAVSLSLSALRNAQGTVELMNDLLRHRGPDGEATWVHDHGVAAFAHRRLAIIDLDSGDQPMTDGGGNWVTYNGEIYNYIELRGLLGKDRFTTTSDTEVILRAYRQWGEGCLERLRGMFAFALWDEETQTLFAARDRFGIKPLYYTVVDGVLYFASEVKALLPFLPEGRDRPRRARRLPDVPVPARRQDALRGHPGAPARPLPARAQRHGRDAALLGGLLRAGLRPHRPTSTSAARRSCSPTRSRSTCARTSRSAPTSAAASTRASSPRSPPRRTGRG